MPKSSQSTNNPLAIYLLRAESSLAANLVELIESVVQPLSRVGNRTGEDRILVDAPDEIVLESELHESPFVDVVLPRRQSEAQRLQIHAVRHLRVQLEHAVHAGLGEVVVERDEREALLAQVVMLRKVLQTSGAHVNVRILEERQQFHYVVVNEVLHAGFHQRVLHVGAGGDPRYVVHAVDVRKDLLRREVPGVEGHVAEFRSKDRNLMVEDFGRVVGDPHDLQVNRRFAFHERTHARVVEILHDFVQHVLYPWSVLVAGQKAAFGLDHD